MEVKVDCLKTFLMTISLLCLTGDALSPAIAWVLARALLPPDIGGRPGLMKDGLQVKTDFIKVLCENSGNR